MGDTNPKLEEDPIETLIGPFGRYQTWILILIIIARMPTDVQFNNVVFIVPGVEYTCLDNNVTNSCPCKNPLYNQSSIHSSVTSEWNLICDRTHLASLAQSTMQFGILVGSIIYGHMSDRFGRKFCVIASMSLEILFTVTSALIPDLWMFLVCRFLIGTSMGGVAICFYVLLVELSGKSFRAYVIGLQEITFIFSYCLLPLIAYFVRDWRHLQLVTSVPWLFTLSYYWLIPESPRWLITSGKIEEATNLLTYIAKKNNRPVDRVEVVVKQISEDSIKSRVQQASYIDLFKTAKIRKRTIITLLLWMLCAFTFFGVNQYIGRLEGNLYLNVFISGICQAPGIILVTVAVLHFKRKITIMTSFTIAALSLLVFIFVPCTYTAAYLAFAVIGMVGIYASFTLVYLYSSELFPTVVRNSALGLGSVFARVGGFVAPFVVNIRIEWLVIIIFSGSAFLAALLCCLLPETRGIVLPNTIEGETDKSRNNSP